MLLFVIRDLHLMTDALGDIFCSLAGSVEVIIMAILYLNARKQTVVSWRGDHYKLQGAGVGNFSHHAAAYLDRYRCCCESCLGVGR